MTQVVSRAKAYLKVRHKAVRDAMKVLKLDGMLLTHAPDLSYLTNFTGEDSIGLITAREFYLVTDFRYQEQAQLEAGWLSIIPRQAKMADALAEATEKAKARRIGFEANYMAVGQLRALEASLAGRKLDKSVELVPLENVLANIRKVKDDHEVDLIRRSVQVAEEAFEAVRGEIRPGRLTENDLAGRLILEVRSRGASDASFPPIVATGLNSSLPHYKPGDALVAADQPLLLDWGASYKGYCSDLTRTLFLGRISERMKRIYRVVLEAQETAIRFLRPGVTTLQADAVARDLIERAGFGRYFGHGLGHGIGREIHELPTMRKTGGEEELRPGMVVTVEPGIYIPGEGGVRIEDNVLITHSGCEVLSTLDKSLEGCHID
jgi:Xaa-Pro aminopeptidase